MCLITRVPELDILFTSANVKIILQGVDCTCNVRTLLVDMDPTLHSLDNSIPCCHACSFRQRTGLAYLLQTLENHMVTIFVHPLLPCRSAPLQADSPQHAPSRAAGGLLVLQRRSHLLRCAWRSLTSCHQPSSLSGCADSWCASGTPLPRSPCSIALHSVLGALTTSFVNLLFTSVFWLKHVSPLTVHED